MFVLYFGGQKSGKSKLAEKKTLKLSQKKKPYYLATYDNSYNDNEMASRIKKHKTQRKKKFRLIEEPKNLPKAIKSNHTYLIDCISMWLLNNINLHQKKLIKQIKKLSKKDTNIVFVLNDINSGIIPIDKISRKFVDLSGIIGQYLASICDEVYEVKLGIAKKIR
jgi:adenosylcobinamide kinase/adenosylcobinamide-phosphate guanylyltransferase